MPKYRGDPANLTHLPLRGQYRDSRDRGAPVSLFTPGRGRDNTPRGTRAVSDDNENAFPWQLSELSKGR